MKRERIFYYCSAAAILVITATVIGAIKPHMFYGLLGEGVIGALTPTIAGRLSVWLDEVL